MSLTTNWLTWEFYWNIIDVEIKFSGQTIEKSEIDSAVAYITKIMKNAVVKAIPKTQYNSVVVWHPKEIRVAVNGKATRRAHHLFQHTHSPDDEWVRNALCEKVTKIVKEYRNYSIETIIKEQELD